MSVPAPRTIHVLYFAWLRERVGTAEETLALPADVATVGELIGWLSQRGEGYASAFATKLVRCAVDQDFAGPDTILRAGNEVAFFPPVTGG